MSPLEMRAAVLRDRLGSVGSSHAHAVEYRRFPPVRRFVTQAMRAGVGKHGTPIHGVIEVDVTEARRRMAQSGLDLSFTAFVVAATAHAVAAHPAVHAYRDWRGRLAINRHVDVAVLVEVEYPGGSFPMAHLLEAADMRNVADLSDELRRVQADPTSSPSGQLLRFAGVLGRIPLLVRFLYAVVGRTLWGRRLAGTVTVSSVGMFGGGTGFGIGFPTIASLGILVGGISRRPWVVGDEILARDIVQLTITVDHDVVDGAPAARFAATLRQLLESADLIAW